MASSAALSIPWTGMSHRRPPPPPTRCRPLSLISSLAPRSKPSATLDATPVVKTSIVRSPCVSPSPPTITGSPSSLPTTASVCKTKPRATSAERKTQPPTPIHSPPAQAAPAAASSPTAPSSRSSAGASPSRASQAMAPPSPSAFRARKNHQASCECHLPSRNTASSVTVRPGTPCAHSPHCAWRHTTRRRLRRTPAYPAVECPARGKDGSWWCPSAPLNRLNLENCLSSRARRTIGECLRRCQERAMRVMGNRGVMYCGTTAKFKRTCHRRSRWHLSARLSRLWRRRLGRCVRASQPPCDNDGRSIAHRVRVWAGALHYRDDCGQGFRCPCQPRRHHCPRQHWSLPNGRNPRICRGPAYRRAHRCRLYSHRLRELRRQVRLPGRAVSGHQHQPLARLDR